MNDDPPGAPIVFGVNLARDVLERAGGFGSGLHLLLKLAQFGGEVHRAAEPRLPRVVPRALSLQQSRWPAAEPRCCENGGAPTGVLRGPAACRDATC